MAAKDPYVDWRKRMGAELRSNPSRAENSRRLHGMTPGALLVMELNLNNFERPDLQMRAAENVLDRCGYKSKDVVDVQQTPSEDAELARALSEKLSPEELAQLWAKINQ